MSVCVCVCEAVKHTQNESKAKKVYLDVYKSLTRSFFVLNLYRKFYLTVSVTEFNKLIDV